MAEIMLTHGKLALVDDDDVEWLSTFPWYGVKCSDDWYAGRTVRVSPKKCVRVYMHRMLLDCPPGLLVDHTNRNTLDNRRENLRIADKSLNALNSKKRRGTSSRYRGVSWCRKHRRWVASIRRDGSSVALGSYLTEEEAARAYNAAAVETYGACANINLIEGLSHAECLVAPVRNRKPGRANGPAQLIVRPIVQACG